MKEITVVVKSNVGNVNSDALAKAGLNLSDVEYIHTSNLEPIRPDGMDRETYFALPRVYNVKIGLKTKCEFCGKIVKDEDYTDHILLRHPEEQ